jgi:hypothetical protein
MMCGYTVHVGSYFSVGSIDVEHAVEGADVRAAAALR